MAGEMFDKFTVCGSAVKNLRHNVNSKSTTNIDGLCRYVVVK